MALPASSARWARWTLRSPFRCAVATLTGFCIYELLDYAKVFTRIGQAATFSYEMYAGVRDGYIEASEWVEWAVMLVDKATEFIRKVTSPGKFFLLVLMLTALGVSYSWFGDAILSRNSSRAQSTTASGASTPTRTQDSQATSTGSDMSKVAEALEKLAREQTAAIQRMKNHAAEERMNRLREEAQNSRAQIAQQEVPFYQRTVGPLPPAPPPSEPQPEGTAARGVEELRRQFEDFKQVVMEDSGTRRRARSSPPASPAPAKEESRAAEGRGRAQEPGPARERGNSVATDKVIADLLAKCEKAGRNPVEKWKQALMQFRQIPVEEWSMPTGYRERLAPEVCSRIYVGRGTFKEAAATFLRDHSLEECLYARGMLDAAESIDRAVLEDSIEGVINTTVFEGLVRQFYAIEVGFAGVRAKGDWLKPRGEKTNWTSKVDFEMVSLLNPRAGDPRTELLRGAEKEVRGEMQRQALFAKAKNDHATGSRDFINAV
jgi:hypothetical protein